MSQLVVDEDPLAKSIRLAEELTKALTEVTVVLTDIVNDLRDWNTDEHFTN